MSVLIKGMEMPKSCKECQVSFGYGNDVYCPFLFEPCDAIEDGLMWKECPKEGELANCPLVPVQTPHGRLGDLDKLWDRMYNYTDNEGAKMPFGDNDFMIHRDSACELVEDAPTIIETEKSEE